MSLARDMGVDVLIVVDVSFPLSRRDELDSALDVTNQMIGIMVRRGTRESRAQLGEGDVLVEPDLGRMTAVDFDKVPRAMEAGEPPSRRRARSSRRCRCRPSAMRRTARRAARTATRTCNSPSCGRGRSRRRMPPASTRSSAGSPGSRSTCPPCSASSAGSMASTATSRSTTGWFATTASSGSRSTRGASPGGPTSCASA